MIIKPFLKYIDTKITCYGYESCFEATLQAPNIECSGYRSCSLAFQLNAIDGYIYCDGVLGCYAVDTIIAIEVYCTNEDSCSFANIIADNVYCESKYSCYHTNVIANYISCSAEFSCKYATLQVFEIATTAQYALEYSQINGNNNWRYVIVNS